MFPLISIIVPVYNAERTISRCVDSILIQEYTNFELILVDDGSKDNSLLVCKGYQQKEPRIKVFHQENLGVSMARNKGIELCCGEWIVFIDSDDYISPSYLRNLISDVKDSDLVIGGNVRICNGCECSKQSYPAKSIDKQNNKNLIDLVLIYGTPWGKLFKSSIIKSNSIRFNRSFQLHEDHIFFFDVIACVEKIKMISATDYFYVNNGYSSLSRIGNIPYLLKWEAYQILSNQLKKIEDRWKLDDISLIQINNFIIRLYISAVIMAYRMHESKDVIKTLLCHADRRKIWKYHKPKSIQGVGIKFVFITFPVFIQNMLFQRIIK